MPDYRPAPGESRWSVWLNRRPAIALVLGVLVVAIGVAFGVLRMQA